MSCVEGSWKIFSTKCLKRIVRGHEAAMMMYLVSERVERNVVVARLKLLYKNDEIGKHVVDVCAERAGACA
jgi:hypothetical protein